MSSRRKTTAPAENVVAYVRVSTEEQVASGAGLDAQRAAIAIEAERRGWTIVDTFADEGVSGGKSVDQRPGLAAAVAAVQAGRAATVLVAKLDRLGRSVHGITGLMVQADREGWTLAACDGTLDTTTPAGKFHTHIMAGVAELERGLISQRTREALAAKKAAGVRLGRPSTLPEAIVARIVTEHADGRSMAAIARDLTTDGTATARGGARWYPSTVKAVLDGQDAARVRAGQMPANIAG